jgi:hypothetical protein
MANGTARRVKIDDMEELGNLINKFKQNEAYALGRLTDGVPGRVEVVRADRLNGATSVIARTKEFLVFKEGKPGLVLLDIDLKGMPEAAKRRMAECGSP